LKGKERKKIDPCCEEDLWYQNFCEVEKCGVSRKKQFMLGGQYWKSTLFEPGVGSLRALQNLQ